MHSGERWMGVVDHRSKNPTTFEWGGAPVAAPLLAAVNCLRELNDSKARKLPRTAPSEFLRKR